MEQVPITQKSQFCYPYIFKHLIFCRQIDQNDPMNTMMMMIDKYILWWSVCLSVCNKKWPLPSWASEARSETLARPRRLWPSDDDGDDDGDDDDDDGDDDDGAEVR